MAVRQFTNQIPVKRIESAWQSEGFPAVRVDDQSVGVRQRTFDAYLNQVDLANYSQCVSTLNVFQSIIDTSRSVFDEEEWNLLFGQLERAVTTSSLRIDRDFLIHLPEPAALEEGALANLTDRAVIYQHLTRIQQNLQHSDPQSVIGSAKELTESTAKLVLIKLGAPFDKKDDLSVLVKKVGDSLSLSPASVTLPEGKEKESAERAANATKKILGSATGIVSGLAELRNAAGTGHGDSHSRSFLETRHARLAVNAAVLWCDHALTTLAAPNAPWRKKNPD